MSQEIKNAEALERFDQACSATIKTMYWIAGSRNNSNLIDFLNRLDASEWKKLFPECKDLDHSRKDYLQLLIDYQKMGFLALVEVPECRNFVYDSNKKPFAWTASVNRNHLRYAYAETTDQLLTTIENIAEECFRHDLAKAATF